MSDKTLRGPLALSIISILLGIFAFLLGGYEVLTEPATPLACSMGMTVLGAGYMLTGCWGICISRKQDREYIPEAVVVHEPPVVLAFGWIVWFGAAFSFFLAFVFCISNDVSVSICMVITALALLFIAFWIFSDCRYRSIVLFRDRIEYTNSFGKKNSFYRVEISQAKWNPATGGYRVFDIEGKKLFSFETNMTNADILTGQFPSVFQNWMIRQEKEETEDPFEKKCSEEYVKKVRIGGFLLFFADFLLSVILLCIYIKTNLIKGRYYYLIMTLIPMNLFVFSWIFRDVVGEISYRRGDPNIDRKKKRWKKSHVSVWGYQFTFFFWNHLVVESGLALTMQCVKGAEWVFTAGLLLFGMVMLISVQRFGLKRSRTEQLFITALLSAFFCYGLTLAVFLAASASPEHYPAKIVSLRESDHGHYATVILRNGTEEEVEISSSIYDMIENKEEVVVCSRTSLFDTEFVKIHRPE